MLNESQRGSYDGESCHREVHETADYESDRYTKYRDSSEFSEARESVVTIAVVEQTKSRPEQSSMYVWVLRGAAVITFLILAVGFWWMTAKSPVGGTVLPPTDKAGTVYHPKAAAEGTIEPPRQPEVQSAEVENEDTWDSAEKAEWQKRVEIHLAEVAKWPIEWCEKCPELSKKLTPETYKEQLKRILDDFTERYPEKAAAFPFDIKEYYGWKVKHGRHFHSQQDAEFEIYSMLYYDWSKFNEEDPLHKLLNGKDISKCRADVVEDKDSSKYSMEMVELGINKKVKRKAFAGSKVETRTIPQDVIDGFKKTSDKTTKIAKKVFDKWEGRKGGPRLCVEDCAMRIGLLGSIGYHSEVGRYSIIGKDGHTTSRKCFIYQRVCNAFLDELLRNDAFRNYLAWKGLRKYSTDGWGTMVYSPVQGYEKLYFVNDKSIGGFWIASGDAWYEHSWNRLTAYVPNGKSRAGGKMDGTEMPAKPKYFADSIMLDFKNWPRIKF